MEQKKEKNNSAGVMGVVMLIMLAGKLTGLYRDIQFTALYGTKTIESMAFTAASNIPRNFLDFAFASSISASFIPVFNTYLKKRDKKQAFALANNFITLILIISTLITVVLVAFAPQIINIANYGFTDETKALTVPLLRIMLFTIVLSGVAFSLTGVLQSLGGFYIPAAMSIISNLMIISYYLFFIDKYGIYGLAAVFLIGWGTQILIQVPSLLKLGYRFKPRLDLKDSGLKEIAVLALPVLVSTWAAPVNQLVNQGIASGLFGGEGLSVINNANTLYSVITGVFILSIANVIFPKLSKQSAADDTDGFATTMRTTVRGMMFFLIPMTFGLCLLGEPIVKLFFERGLFDAFSTQHTGFALTFYSLGMPGFGLVTILNRGFYAEKDGKTPMLTGLAAIVINLVLSVILTPYLNVGGPALASSLSINAVGLIMLIVMGKNNKGMFNKKMFNGIVKMLVCAVFMAVAVWFSFRYLSSVFEEGFVSTLISVAITVFLGAAAYLTSAFLLKLEEISLIFSVLKKLKRGRANE